MSPQDKKRITALKRRVSRARDFPHNTCGASRHLHIMADSLLATKKDGSLRYAMLQEEPEHCAESILAVLAALWEARTLLDKLQPDRVKERSKLIKKLTRKLRGPALGGQKEAKSA